MSTRSRLLSVNQEEIAAFVVERVTVSAGRDPFAWFPATGWVSDGEPFGLAAALFGETWSNRQLDQLARVLFRLGVAKQIEIAEFRWRDGQTALASRPHSQGDGALYSLAGPGSRKLDVPNNAYAVRLVGNALPDG
jgi:hypothetical protein